MVVFGDKKVSRIPESYVGICGSWPVQASNSHVTTRVFSVTEYKKCTQTSRIKPYRPLISPSREHHGKILPYNRHYEFIAWKPTYLKSPIGFNHPTHTSSMYVCHFYQVLPMGYLSQTHPQFLGPTLFFVVSPYTQKHTQIPIAIVAAVACSPASSP